MEVTFSWGVIASGPTLIPNTTRPCLKESRVDLGQFDLEATVSVRKVGLRY